MNLMAAGVFDDELHESAVAPAAAVTATTVTPVASATVAPASSISCIVAASISIAVNVIVIGNWASGET